MSKADSHELVMQSEIFGSMFFLTQQIAHETDAAMVSLNITTKQWVMLAIMVRRFPGRAPTLSEVAKWYGSSRQNVKMIAKQLETAGYLKIKEDPEDRRALRLHCTSNVKVFDTPREMARQAKLMRRLFSWATPEDLRVLREIMDRWVKELVPEEH